jgi:pilus assembly protein CpaB
MGARFGSVGNGRRSAMRERMLYVGGGALTFALAAIVALIIYSYNEVEATQSVAAPAQQMDQIAFGTVVLVAPKAAVPNGTKLSQVAFREVHWPRNEVPEGAIRNVADIRDMYAKVDLPGNQPILRANLSPTPLIGGVADLIPPGHRATTIEVDATSGVEGWATPGARVDVIVTYHDTRLNVKKTQIAVEDAVVVSFNGQTRTGGGIQGAAGSVNVPRFSNTATVTLAVPTNDALRIHTARAMGKISLILRNTGDVKATGDLSVSQDDFQRGAKEENTKSEATGFVRYSTGDGERHQIELHKDNKWYAVEDDL